MACHDERQVIIARKKQRQQNCFLQRVKEVELEMMESQRCVCFALNGFLIVVVMSLHVPGRDLYGLKILLSADENLLVEILGYQLCQLPMFFQRHWNL